MKSNFLRWLQWIIVFVAVIWILLTFWVEAEGPAGQIVLGNSGTTSLALIVYDPDPLYNLDQQVCEAFGKGLADNGWKVTVATVRKAKRMKDTSFQLYVFCANTYNWWPDWAITNFIKNNSVPGNRDIIAITLGAGSTGHSKKVFEKIIINSNGKLAGSKTFWLWMPNDEARLQESNTAVAVDMARNWGKEIGEEPKRKMAASERQTNN